MRSLSGGFDGVSGFLPECVRDQIAVFLQRVVQTVHGGRSGLIIDALLFRVVQQDHIFQREDRIAVKGRGHSNRRVQAFCRFLRHSLAFLQDGQMQKKQADNLVKVGAPARIFLEAFKKPDRPPCRENPLIVSACEEKIEQLSRHGGDHIGEIAEKSSFRKPDPLFRLFSCRVYRQPFCQGRVRDRLVFPDGGIVGRQRTVTHGLPFVVYAMRGEEKRRNIALIRRRDPDRMMDPVYSQVCLSDIGI